MPTCRQCERSFEAEELVRHEYDGRLLVVHCPDCHMLMGSYRIKSPLTDARRE